MVKKRKGIKIDQTGLLKWIGLVIFIVICMAMFFFFRQFYTQTEGQEFLSYDEVYVVKNGEEKPVKTETFMQEDMMQGDTYILKGTLSGSIDHGFLMLNGSMCSIRVWVGDQKIFSGDMSQSIKDLEHEVWVDHVMEIALPEDYEGKDFTIRYRFHGEPEDFVTMNPRISSFDTERRMYYIEANQFTIYSTFYTTIAILICGVFILSLTYGKAEWSLIVLALAPFALAIYQLNLGMGDYFFNRDISNVLDDRWFQLFPTILLMIFLLMNFKKGFLKKLGKIIIVSSIILLAVYVISALRGGEAAMVINNMMIMAFKHGEIQELVSWITIYLIYADFGLSIYNVVSAIIAMQGERQTLEMKTQVMKDGYEAMENNYLQTRMMRHEMKNHFAVMNVLYQQNNMEKLGEYIEKLNTLETEFVSKQFTKHFLINVIVQNYACRMEKDGIDFETSIQVDEHLSIEENDLTSLLMNLLENAMEACARIKEEDKKKVILKVREKNGYLAIYCSNTFDGVVSQNENGSIRTRKVDRTTHGYGIRQMEQVAKKYQSILDISYTDNVFVVQTALKIMPEN